jgi:hypothetical protein
MANIIDTVIALRVLWILITPIENTDAFKCGLIDADGKTIKKAKTPEEKKSTSALHRMVWNLKRLISIVPGGSTRIGSLAAGYLLMKEALQNNWTEEQLAEQVNIQFQTLCEANESNDEIKSLLHGLLQINEDAPVNSSQTTNGDSNVCTDVPKKSLGLARRQSKKSIVEKIFSNTIK